MIPKIIHYCWLSGDPIPKKLQNCMNTWKEKLPDYEFILWDTKLFEISSTKWTEQAFKVELYAYAADYIRLYALYNYGGVYLDMDIEVLKPFDELLGNDIFLAHENAINDSIEAGCFGACKGHDFIKKCMEYFENRNFFDPDLLLRILKLKRIQRVDFINPPIIPEVMSGIIRNNTIFKEIPILPYTYFTTKNSMTGAIDIQEHTFSIHHYASTYHSKAWQVARDLEQKIFSSFGNKAFFAKFLIHGIQITRRLLDDGFKKTFRHYIFVIQKKIAAKRSNKCQKKY